MHISNEFLALFMSPNQLVLLMILCLFPRGEVVCEQPIAKMIFKLGIMKCGPDGKPSKTTFTRLSYNGRTSVVRCKF